MKTHIHNIYQKVDVTKKSMLIQIYKKFCNDMIDELDTEIIN